MKNLRLTPVKDCAILNSNLEDTTTAGLIEFGLRQGGLDSEYHLANRLQSIRELALELAVQSMEEGYSISDSFLKLLDVQVEVAETKRMSKTSV